MKYHDNMTQAELEAFKAEIDALDAAYAHDAAQQANASIPDEWEDEAEYWRRAGLDSRGRP